MDSHASQVILVISPIFCWEFYHYSPASCVEFRDKIPISRYFLAGFFVIFPLAQLLLGNGAKECQSGTPPQTRKEEAE